LALVTGLSSRVMTVYPAPPHFGHTGFASAIELIVSPRG
jgi:hypothetical protein